MKGKHIIVFVSGYSLAENKRFGRVLDRSGNLKDSKFGDWDLVCWGNPATGALGRIPMALLVAHLMHADEIVWSTGATMIENGPWESQEMFRYARDNYERLFTDFPHHFSKEGWVSQEAYRNWLYGRSVFDIDSHNTSSSMQWLASYVSRVSRNVNARHVLVCHVESANHSRRAGLDAMNVFNYDYARQAHRHPFILFDAPAQTNYGGKGLSDLRILDLGQ